MSNHIKSIRSSAAVLAGNLKHLPSIVKILGPATPSLKRTLCNICASLCSVHIQPPVCKDTPDQKLLRLLIVLIFWVHVHPSLSEPIGSQPWRGDEPLWSICHSGGMLNDICGKVARGLVSVCQRMCSTVSLLACCKLSPFCQPEGQIQSLRNYYAHLYTRCWGGIARSRNSIGGWSLSVEFRTMVAVKTVCFDHWGGTRSSAT